MSGEEIVVGIDGSPSARAALRWAADQARLTGSALRAVNIVDWPIGTDEDGKPGMKFLSHLQDEHVRGAYRRSIEAIFATVDPSPDWTLQFELGRPGHVLVREAERARLLVIGTGEHVGLGRMLIGSTSHYCLSRASCPVVAVPQTELDEAERAAVSDDEQEEPAR